MIEEKLSSLGVGEKQPIDKGLINKKGKSPISGLVEDIRLGISFDDLCLASDVVVDEILERYCNLCDLG